MPAEWVGSTTPCGLCLHFTLIRFIVSISIIVWIQFWNQSYDDHNLASVFFFIFVATFWKFPIGEKRDSPTLKFITLLNEHEQTQSPQTDWRRRGGGGWCSKCAVKVSHPSKSALSRLHLPRSVWWCGFGVVLRRAERSNGSPSPWRTPMIVSIFSWDEIKSLRASDINLLQHNESFLVGK